MRRFSSLNLKKYILFSFWTTSDGAQELFLASYSEITYWQCTGTYVDATDEVGVATYKARALLALLFIALATLTPI